MKYTKRYADIDAVQWIGTEESKIEIEDFIKEYNKNNKYSNLEICFHPIYSDARIREKGIVGSKFFIYPKNWLIKDSEGKLNVLTNKEFNKLYKKYKDKQQ